MLRSYPLSAFSDDAYKPSLDMIENALRTQVVLMHGSSIEFSSVIDASETMLPELRGRFHHLSALLPEGERR